MKASKNLRTFIKRTGQISGFDALAIVLAFALVMGVSVATLKVEHLDHIAAAQAFR